MNRLRNWIIRKLLTEDEKFILAEACKSRCDKLRVLAITEKTVDYDNAMDDINTICLLRRNITGLLYI